MNKQGTPGPVAAWDRKDKPASQSSLTDKYWTHRTTPGPDCREVEGGPTPNANGQGGQTGGEERLSAARFRL